MIKSFRFILLCENAMKHRNNFYSINFFHFNQYKQLKLTNIFMSKFSTINQTNMLIMIISNIKNSLNKWKINSIKTMWINELMNQIKKNLIMFIFFWQIQLNNHKISKSLTFQTKNIFDKNSKNFYFMIFLNQKFYSKTFILNFKFINKTIFKTLKFFMTNESFL